MRSILAKIAHILFILIIGGIGVQTITSCSSDDDVPCMGCDDSGGGSVVSGPSVSYGGETYETVVIGSQTWFRRNLNYNASGSVCYDNQASNCATYGRLYNWATAMDLDASCNSSTCASQISAKHRGICPSGWHIPSDAEWATLTGYVGGASTAGTKLKSRSGWNSFSGVPAGTDNYGFSALPGGYGNSGGGFVNAGSYGLWWSASEYSSSFAYHVGMLYLSESAGWHNYTKDFMFSVRCVQD